MGAPSQTGYLEPDTPNLYLDAEDTGRTGPSGAAVRVQTVRVPGGTITVSNPQGTVTVAGTVPTRPTTIGTVAGTVAVSALPAVSGTVAVSSIPNVAGTVSVLSQDLDYRYSGGKTARTQLVAAAGDTTLVTPAAGKAIRLFWVSFVPSPDNQAANLFQVRIGSSAKYLGYAVAHWEVFDGAADESLIVNAATSAPVAVTVHYQEFAP